jgi:hypothetical protein
MLYREFTVYDFCFLETLTGNPASNSSAVHKMHQYRDERWGDTNKHKASVKQLIKKIEVGYFEF